MIENKTRKTQLKAILLIILTTIIVVIISISNNTFAKIASDSDSPVDYLTTKQISYPSIFDLLPAEQRDGDYIYIKYEDLIKYPSIMCSAAGVSIPGYSSTLVAGGGRVTDHTDGGKPTGYLTMNDKGATIFKDGTRYSNEPCPFSYTTSKTYGRFHIVGTYKATPAEGWVLSELDMNNPEKNAIVFEYTDQEWTDTTNIIDANKHLGANNTTLWAVEWDQTSLQPTTFVAEKNGKYYVVKADSYAPYTYVQSAWWKVKNIGRPAIGGIKDTDLAHEAEAFEEYIKKIAVYQNQENYRKTDENDVAIGKWQWNPDNTINVNYKEYESLDGQKKQLGYDSSKYEVRFNSETNKYIVGPFTLNYLRAGTKQGTRDKVSFSGISQSSLFGLDSAGNRLLDSNGETILKLGQNYRYVYDHDHDAYIPTITSYYDGQAKDEKLDTAADYPYPYDGEEFYIEIDYLDDLVALDELDFDFQYMNAGGEFEYLEGTFLDITWSPRYQLIYSNSNGGTSSGAVVTNEKITLGMADLSNRAGSSARAIPNLGKIGSLTAKESTSTKGQYIKKTLGSAEITVDNLAGFDANPIKVKYKPTYEDKQTVTSSYGITQTSTIKVDYTYTYSYSTENSALSTATSFNGKSILIDRFFDSPVEEFKIEITENAVETIVYSTTMPIPNMPTGPITRNLQPVKRYATIQYNNRILTEEFSVAGSDALEVDKGIVKINKIGTIDENDLKFSVLAKFDHRVGEVTYGSVTYKFNGNPDKQENRQNIVTEQNCKQDRNFQEMKIQVKSDLVSDVIQEFTFNVYIPPMHTYNSIATGLGDESYTFTVYNIYKTLNAPFPDLTFSNPPIIYVPTNEEDFANGYFTYTASPEAVPDGQDSASNTVVYQYTDGANTTITLSLEGTVSADKESNILDLIPEEIRIIIQNEGGSGENSGGGSGENSGGGSGENSGGGSGGGSGENSGGGSGGNSGGESNQTIYSDEYQQEPEINEEELRRQIEELEAYLNELREEKQIYENALEEQRQSTIEQIQSEYSEKTERLKEIDADLLRYTQDEADIERVLPTLTDDTQRAEYTKRLQEVRVTIVNLEQERLRLNAEIEKLVKEYNNISELTAINAELEELQKQKEAKQQEISDVESKWADLQGQRKENRDTKWTEENGETIHNKEIELSDKSDQVTKEMVEKYKELSKIRNTITEKQARQRVLLREIDEQLDKEEVDLTKKLIETEAKIQTVENAISRLESILNYGIPTSVGNNGNQAYSSGGPQSGGISPNAVGMPEGPGEYEYWLKFTDATEETAQYQIEGREAVKKDIDATNGRGVDPAGEAIHLQIFPKRIDLRTRLGGMVWIDEETQKGNTNGELGTKDGNEKPAAKNSVEIVVWKVKYEKGDNTYKEVERKKAIAWLGNENADGTFAVSRTLNFIDGPEGENYKGRLFINENGEYKIDKIQVPAEQGLDTSKYKIAYDVEFVYDGQTYEATEFLKSTGKDDIAGKVAEFKKTESETAGVEKDYEAYKNDSYIVENAEERKDFDSYFTEVYGDQEMKVESGVSQEDGQTQITATTEGKATGSKGTGNQAKSQYEKVEYGDTTTDVEANLHYESTDITDATTRKTTDLVTHNAQGFILDQYRFAARTSEGGLMYAYENLYHVKKDYYDNFKFQNSLYKPVDEYFTQINLGLVERYPTDISVLKDLYKAKVVVAEQENDYTYNAWGELTEESLNKRVEAGYRTQTYNIGLYNSDYFYRSSVYNTVVDPITKSVLKAIKDDTELRLFVTYRIAITNESEFTDVSINEFKDYYDKSFTLVGSESDKIEGETADTAADKLQTDEDGNMLAYISTSNAKDIAREQKVVAYKPYYRKLKANTNNSELYKWNRKDDLENADIDAKVSDGNELVTGTLDFNSIDSGNPDYKGSISTGLNALSSDGKSVNADMTLEPGEKFEVFVTYEVDQEAFKEIQKSKAEDADSTTAGTEVSRDAKLLGSKYNIAEVTTYSTAYTEEHVARHKTTSFAAGQISGKVDRDSAPDNIIKSEMRNDNAANNFEDDTEAAPVLSVKVNPNNETRELNGTVWEDARGDKEEGDGIYTPKAEGAETGDETIDGVDVTLVEKINVTPSDVDHIKEYANNPENNVPDDVKSALNNIDTTTLDYEFEYIWPDGTFDVEGAGEEGKFYSKTKTKDGGNYEFRNMVAGNYVVRFEYGNNEETLKYNGQDYKNTAYQVGALNATAERNEQGEIFKGNVDGTVNGTATGQTLAEANIAGTRTTLNNQWHDVTNNDYANKLNGVKSVDVEITRADGSKETMKTTEVDSSLPRVSDARDYEPRRMQVNAYSRTITNKNAEVLAAYVNKQEEGSVNVDYYKEILESNKEDLMTNTAMVANTGKIVVDIEKQSEIVYDPQVSTTSGDQNGSSAHKYVIPQIDFGLVLRPETRMYIQKEIARIDLTKGEEPNEDVLLSVSMDEEGNIIKAGGSADQDTVRVEKITEIRKEELVGQGFKYIGMEASYMNGMKIQLTYNIKVTNESEDDYITEKMSHFKNIQDLYNEATYYESHPAGQITDEEYTGLSPFNTGKGIVYGQLVGLHYYTNTTEAAKEGEFDLSNKYKFAYNGENRDVKVTTTVDQLVDYIDNDIARNQDRTSAIVDQSWVDSSETDRQQKLSAASYVGNSKEDKNGNSADKNLQDNKGRSYIATEKNNIAFSANEQMLSEPIEITHKAIDMTDSGEPKTEVVENADGNKTIMPVLGNRTTKDVYTTVAREVKTEDVDIYNSGFTRQLLPHTAENNDNPEQYSATIKIVTSQQANEQTTDNMNYDNLIEYAMYSNTVGRRDMQTIPGNANMIAKEQPQYWAGYEKVAEKAQDGTVTGYKFQAKQTTINDKSGTATTILTERDAYAPKDTITFSEPTGLSLERQRTNTIIRIILTSLIIAAITIMTATVVVVLKKTKKYDDKDLLDTNEKN